MIEAPDEEENLPREENSAEVFYLWDCKKDAFNIFCIARLYLKDGLELDPALIIKLCEKRNADIEEVLLDLAVMLDGYLSILNPDKKPSENKEPLDDR